MSGGTSAPRQSAPAGPAAAKRRKGPRPKHVPQRMCVACRERDAKRALRRVVRTPEGTVEVDPTGKRNGRGAYLCDRAACWERAATTPVLARALRTELSAETTTALRDYAATLPPAPEPGAADAGEGTS